jgi:hypothetical protein
MRIVRRHMGDNEDTRRGAEHGLPVLLFTRGQQTLGMKRTTTRQQECVGRTYDRRARSSVGVRDDGVTSWKYRRRKMSKVQGLWNHRREERFVLTFNYLSTTLCVYVIGL